MGKIKGWKKIVDNSFREVWQNEKVKVRRINLRWNPVTRNYQLYLTDGDMEVQDFGKFREKDYQDAKDIALRFMKKYNWSKKELQMHVRINSADEGTISDLSEQLQQDIGQMGLKFTLFKVRRKQIDLKAINSQTRDYLYSFIDKNKEERMYGLSNYYARRIKNG